MKSSKNTKNSEKQLVLQLKQGNSKAVREWFKLYHQYLLKIAKIKISNQKDAEDVVQETMINALRQMQLFRQEASLKTWLTTILRHEIADYYRKKYAKRAIKTVPLGDRLLSKPISDSEQVQEVVKKTLSKMTHYRKNLLLMKYVDGLKIKQIAQQMGKSFKSVESELWRSKDLFKKLYAQEIGNAK